MFYYHYFIPVLLANYFTAIDAHVAFQNGKWLKRDASCTGFQCASGECISDEFECDGAVNCKDGSDETFACRNLVCPRYLFRCAYGACINGDFECDGKQDCKDNSDETTAKCKKTVTEAPPDENEKCGPGKFTCKSGDCIDELDLCDGIVNCPDKSDETRETCANINCAVYTYKCAYGGCVDGNARCNGVQECVDNSDEDGCANVVTTSTTPAPTTTTKKVEDQSSCIIPTIKHGFVVAGNGVQLKPGDKVPLATQVIFRCSKYRHVLMPNNNVSYCLGGIWVIPPPKCEKICDPIPQTKELNSKCYLHESVVDCNRPTHETRAKLSCAPLYEDFNLKQNPYRICKDGTWDTPLPKCIAECGLKFVNAQTLIIGGTVAKKDHWPWVVAVYEQESKKHICGGSLLNEKVVLSAAHCFTDNDGRKIPENKYAIAGGKHYREYGHLDDKTAQFSNVSEIIIPPDYHGDIQNFRADIAIVVLTDEFTLTNNVRPVCVDLSSILEVQQFKPGNKGVVLGWGLTKQAGEASDELKELDVPFYPNNDCSEHLPLNFRRFVTTGDKICGGYLNSNISVCQGDSGGGYVFSSDDRYYIRGIVSVSPRSPSGSCDSDTFTLFTRVSHYIDFVNYHEKFNRP